MWGSLADEESLALAQKLVGGKISPSVKPGQMRILDEPVRFTVHGASTAPPVAYGVGLLLYSLPLGQFFKYKHAYDSIEMDE